jgi:hypothetical protein
MHTCPSLVALLAAYWRFEAGFAVTFLRDVRTSLQQTQCSLLHILLAVSEEALGK